MDGGGLSDWLKYMRIFGGFAVLILRVTLRCQYMVNGVPQFRKPLWILRRRRIEESDRLHKIGAVDKERREFDRERIQKQFRIKAGVAVFRSARNPKINLLFHLRKRRLIERS